MGCVSSREARLDRLRSSPSYGRSVSMPVVHGSRRKGDSLHVVSLTSSTIGFLKLSRSHESSDEETINSDRDQNTPETIGGAGAGVNNKPAEPESETINAWELMEGLEDETAPPRHPTCPAILDRSFSFDHRRGSPEPHPAKFKSSQTSSAGSPKPSWFHSVTGDYLQLDPDVISNFRKAMTELSPQHPTLLHRSPVTYRPDEIPRFPGIVKARVAAFEEKIDARRGSFKPAASCLKVSSLKKSPPGGKGKVVLYSTSLRGVRTTFENCCNARVILHIYGVRIDERDVSMHRGYRDELNEILGYGYGGTTLPRIFVNGRHLGGAEQVAQLHEAGELAVALKDCEMAATAMNGGGGITCEGCGDYRFLPCVICSGSCKVFVEEEEDEIGGFRRCTTCNENGLVRCHLCC